MDKSMPTWADDPIDTKPYEGVAKTPSMMAFYLYAQHFNRLRRYTLQKSLEAAATESAIVTAGMTNAHDFTPGNVAYWKEVEEQLKLKLKRLNV